MATRSRIAIENQSGTVISIYCHWDGHIKTNGKILFENYDREKTEQLIALGDISHLDTTIETTKAYHRDMNEDLYFKTFPNVEDLFESGFNVGEEFVYCLTKDNIWLVNEFDSNNVAVLKEALEEIEA